MVKPNFLYNKMSGSAGGLEYPNVNKAAVAQMLFAEKQWGRRVSALCVFTKGDITKQKSSLWFGVRLSKGPLLIRER